MKSKTIHRIFALFVLASIGFWCQSSASAGQTKVGVLLSKRIAPYMKMAEGLETGLKEPCDLFFLNRDLEIVTEEGRAVLGFEDRFSIYVAIGPQALSTITSKVDSMPVVYGMVLKPELISNRNTDVAGISLNIFSQTMLKDISVILPEVKKVGVLYNPENDSRWFVSALMEAGHENVKIVPLKVSQRSAIMEVLENNASKIDALLFVPDKTVVSKKLVEYIIKQSIYKKVPVIGYNRFFHESGAAVSFVIDYNRVGVRAGEMVEKRLDNGEVSSQDPVFDIFLNGKVIRLMDVKVGSELPERASYK